MMRHDDALSSKTALGFSHREIVDTGRSHRDCNIFVAVMNALRGKLPGPCSNDT